MHHADPSQPHPHCSYALTLSDLQNIHTYMTPVVSRGKKPTLRLPFFTIELQTRRVVVVGGFIGQPYSSREGRLVQHIVPATSGQHGHEPLDLAYVGVIPYDDGRWASRFCIAEANAHLLVDFLLQFHD